jgi:hypothetical protein
MNVLYQENMEKVKIFGETILKIEKFVEGVVFCLCLTPGSRFCPVGSRGVSLS